MTRKSRRLAFLLTGFTALAAAAALVLSALEDSIVFFYSPSDIAARDLAPDRRLRIGGVVAESSVKRLADGVTTEFIVTDFANTLAVRFTGVLPDLFREGQGVVAEGRLAAGGIFRAENVLAKHDETYMPPEVADALKKSGQWKGGAAK